ncbi:MAG: putative sulfate exporter family transporter [Bacteroidales bacterium]|nr:putative sulfate exporter family transporter [Bacteroidales bacterium]
MSTLTSYFEKYKNVLYIFLLLLCLLPVVTPPVALFAGLIFALGFGQAFPKFNKKMSKYLLQGSVVGLGFGMSLQQAYASGKDGMLFTIVSVAGTLILGTFIARKLNVDKKTGYLISSGTAICGGSAIAAVGPVIKANDGQMSVALGTVFILNAVALFLFPFLGHLLGLSQHQFGLWSAIAIHDTSSVVGAASAYGEEALRVATTVKLTRALWIIPVSFVTSFIFKSKSDKIAIPWFIFLFILAMAINSTFNLPVGLTSGIVRIARKGLTLSLFFIGASLTKTVLRNVGVRPMIQGVIIWIIVCIVSLSYIYFVD